MGKPVTTSRRKRLNDVRKAVRDLESALLILRDRLPSEKWIDDSFASLKRLAHMARNP